MFEDDKIIHPHNLATAHVVIKCKSGFEKHIIDSLENIVGVQDINRTTGEYDIMVKLVSLDYDSLKRIIRWKIQKIPNIESMSTLICMRKPLCVTLD